MDKQVIITNGVGSSNIVNGSYTVTADANGYDNSSINPSTVNIVDGTNEYNFTISASGTLTLHVTEEGTAGGTPVVGATFIRTDSEGNEYGSLITTDAEGNALFENVPFAASDAPTIYFKQTASDGSHEFDNSVQNTTLTTNAETLEITNQLAASRTINLTDANYDNLPVGTATLTFTNN